MDDDTIAPLVEDVTRALGSKVPKDRVKSELERFISHGLPPHQAARDVLRLLSTEVGGVRKHVRDIGTADQAVDLLVKVLTVEPRQVTARGTEKTIWSGYFGDETGTIPFTAWVNPGLEAGATIEVLNAYVTVWQGRPQVNLNERTSVSPSNEELDVAPPPTRGGVLKVRQLRAGQGGVTVTGRILSLQERALEIQGEARTLWDGILVDETGGVRFTSWKPIEASAGDTVRIVNGYVREFRGFPSLNLGDYTTAAVVPDSIGDPLAAPTPLGALNELHGVMGIRVVAPVLEIRQGSGLVFRCPECRRILERRECRTHGRVEGTPDLRAKAILDDGTGTGSALFGRELVETVLGKTLDDCIAMAREAVSHDVVEDLLRDKLVGRYLDVVCDATRDDYGLTLLVRAAGFSQPRPHEVVPRLLERTQGVSP